MLTPACATRTTTSGADTPGQAISENAPLGSRIKKRTGVSPVSGITREDVENAKVMQGAQQTGAAQRTPN
jgi:hypothetical protein